MPAPRFLLLSATLASLTLAGCGRAPVAAAPAGAKRICSLTLAGDEILAHLVDPARVVAVTRFVDDDRLSNVRGHYPPSVRRIHGADLEEVVSLAPDLVLLSPHNDADFLALVQSAGLRTLTLDAHGSIAAVEDAYRAIGAVVDEEQRTAVVVRWMDAELDTLARALHGIEHRPRVVFWAGGFSAGPATTVGELIERAGGANVAAELGLRGSAEVDTERVVAADPAYILISRWEVTDAAGYTELPPAFRTLAALREGRVVEIDGRLLDTLSAHLVEGAWRLAWRLHPERISEEALARVAAGPPPR